MSVEPRSTSDKDPTSISRKSSTEKLAARLSFNKQAVKDLRYREEWEEDKQPATQRELRAWYFYDFAHSGFPSAAAVLWVPILLFVMARDHACPYTKLPENPDKMDPLYWDPFDGHNNASMAVCGRSYWQIQDGWEDVAAYGDLIAPHGLNHTIYADCTSCKLDSSAIPGYGRWMERGNPDFGMPTYPANIRKQEGTEDDDENSAKTRMLIDDDYLSYSSIDYANNLICEPFTGEVSVTPIYNMSIYSANGMTEEAVDTDGVSDVKHKNAYSMADVAFTTTTTGTPLVTSDIDLVLSTNVNLFNSSSTWSVAVDTTASALDTSDPKVQHWVLTLTPEPFAVGSTTVKFKIGDAYTRFTFTALEFQICPYTVGLMGMQLKPVAFATITVSISVAFQAVIFLSTSALGDFGPYRKMIMIQSAFVAALCCCAYIFLSESSDFIYGAYLLIIIQVCLGLSVCMYNAYIPELARNSEQFLKMMGEYKSKTGDFDPNKRNVRIGGKKTAGATELLVKKFGLIQDDISETGHIWGYSGATLNVVFSTIIVFVIGFHQIILGIKGAMFFMGVWWMIFTIPAIISLRKRSGPPLPGDSNFITYIWFSIKRSVSTIIAISKHIPNTRNFMIAFFFYTDGISTISQCGVLFAINEMGMTTLEFVFLAFVSPLFGALNMWFVQKMQKKYAWETKDILLFSICMYTFICAWGLLGFTKVIGYVYKEELYLIVVFYGGYLAVYESASRTTFCELVPPGQTAEFFGIYEISDKGSSWIGPFIVGLLYDAYGSVRYGFIYLFVICFASVYIIYFHVDYVKGANDARDKSKNVRMEAIRSRFGVSKKQIQAEIKKRKKMSSSVMSSGASSAASGSSRVSSASSAVSSMSSASSMSTVEN